VTAYYNEVDPVAAAWLRQLINRKLIAYGIVDERSIEDVKPEEIKEFTQCHFFAGIGVWSYALKLAGWPDDKPVWTGSCPCQPFSAAGKGAGFADERHLWPAWYHLISQCNPSIIFGEQVASADGLKWLDLVCSDLEAHSYTTGAADLCAAGVGAPHIRQRLYWVGMADSYREGLQRQRQHELLASSPKRQDQGRHTSASSMAAHFWQQGRSEQGRAGKLHILPPIDGSMAHGSTGRLGRLRGYGNAIVAQVAATFIQSVS